MGSSRRIERYAISTVTIVGFAVTVFALVTFLAVVYFQLSVGSSRDRVVRQNLFGAFADEIANRARCSVVMVHSPETMSVSLWRQAVGYLRLGGPRRERFARVDS